MCNLAAYIGNRLAAPILLEMIEKQEGFAGGFYTGIATVDKGKIHYRKVIGDAAALREKTDAENLPGNVGIVHSRSNGGGDENWAHPFVDEAEQIAYVANGHMGFFDDPGQTGKIMKGLLSKGYEFHLENESEKYNLEAYPVLQDKTHVHISEIMCFLISDIFQSINNPVAAMKQAFIQFPSEVVGLSLNLAEPGAVIASRYNQPLMIGRTKEETYLSSTALALPDNDKLQISYMPTDSAAIFYKNHYQVFSFDINEKRTAQIMPWEEGFSEIRKQLRERKRLKLNDLKNAVEKLWPRGFASQKDMLVYEILRVLFHKNEISFDLDMVPGVLEHVDAPQIMIRYCDH